MVKVKRQLPLWVATMLVFLLLFITVCVYFLWQINEMEDSVLLHARQYADIVSKVVSLNARGTIEAEESVENILQNLLGNSARFVAYLDMIEPFSSDELTAFTRQNGLAGITVIRNGSVAERVVNTNKKELPVDTTQKEISVNGPADWLPQGFTWTGEDSSPAEMYCSSEPVMIHLPESHLYILLWREPDYPGRIALGIKDDNIAAITESLGLKNIVKAISTVPGIREIEIHNLKVDASNGKNSKGNISNEADRRVIQTSLLTSPAIIQQGKVDIVRAIQIVQGMAISVGVDAGHLAQSVRQLTIHFYLFSFFLVITATLLSSLLHRYQTSVLNRVKQFERELAAQREHATLGKSAAAIAHEIRNPLNALSMGLQRLQLENVCTSEMHIPLIHQMSEAVKRANSSVTGLLNYARPRVPSIKAFFPEDLIVDILNLYENRCLTLNIDIKIDIEYRDKIASDPELMGQVIENIIKNAVEAQPDGGFIHVSITETLNGRHIKLSSEHCLVLIFKNSNCPIHPDNAHQILEPYFTTRPDGTGLGMAIVNNIVKTLDGEIKIEVTESRDISTIICLPIT